MAGFLGSFTHQVDAAGRVSLPVAYRKGREDEPFVMIHARPETPSLSLYPEDAWAEKQDEFRQLVKRSPEFKHQVLRVTSSAVEVVPDKQGRILIPERMRSAIGLETEALVAGAIDHIEIWEPARFEQQTAPDDPEFQRHLDKILA